ncbi:acyltransferase family protein [Sphingobium sp. H39-3-25]|uniref:acyltransferase family protein n=1 Tax=Sphingobium arseniciresistens TaxID=3030834 RepID=UPI0023BA23FC|nr:acyltransferase family protein [Sphingobium arseniciresistens]
MSETSGRIDWIDHLRGLGIVLVVIGHVTSSAPLHHWIFLFHMPLFFLLSGYLARPRAPWLLARSRFFALLVPYAAFLLLVAGLDYIWGRIDGSGSMIAHYGPVGSVVRLVFGGSALVEVFGTFWFVPCLYVAGLILNQIVGHRQAMGLALAAIILGVAISYLVPAIPSPLGVVQVPMALALMACGWLARGRGSVSPAVLAIATILFVVAGTMADPFDMKYLSFGTFPTNIVSAIAGTVTVAGVAQWLGRVTVIGSGLSLLGRASLVIMFLHQLINVHLHPYAGDWLTVVVAILLPLAFWWAVGRGALTSRLFLGRA